MHSKKEYSSFRERSEAEQRVKIAKELGRLARKCLARGRRGREFSADDPCQNLFPILRRGGPTGVLRPFPLHCRVPVAFVTPAEAFFLLRDPAGIRVYARLGYQCECGLFALSARIDAEARGDRIHRDANIELTGFPLPRRGNGKLQVHMRFVKRLVLRETNIPVDPRKIRAGTSGRVEARIEFQRCVREFFQQAAERLNKSSLIAVTVRVHPLLPIVSAAVLEKLKRFAGEHGFVRCHGTSVSNLDATRRPSGYTIPNQRQLDYAVSLARWRPSWRAGPDF